MSRLAKFDKVAVGELNANLLGVKIQLVVKAKLVSTRTGESFGSTTISNWSPLVIEKFGELIHLMEQDIEKVFFDEDGEDGGSTKDTNTTGGGLGEHLTGEDAPSV